MGFGGNIISSRGPIGVAVAQRAVHLAQAKPGGGYVFASQDLPIGSESSGPVFHADTSRAIASALKQGKFAGKFAVSAMPVGMLRYKTLRMPPMPEQDLASAIAWEASERFQTTEQDVLQHYNAGQVKQGDETREEIIVLAADGASVYDHASAVKHAGLVPIAVDATGAALSRVLGAEGQSTLIIDLGEKQAEVVACTGSRVVFDKLIELTVIHDRLDEVALSRELSLCVRYLSVTFGIHPPDAAWLCGRYADTALGEHLTAALHHPVRPAAQSPAAQQLGTPGGDPSPWLVAAGLAQRDEAGSAQRGAA